MTQPNIRFIHYTTEKFCIAVQDIDDDFVSVSAAFTAPNDNYSRKTARQICKHRATAISDKPTRYAMIAARSSFKENTLIGIWVELHERIYKLRKDEVGWTKLELTVMDDAGVESNIVEYLRNDNDLFWHALYNDLNAEVVSTK